MTSNLMDDTTDKHIARVRTEDRNWQQIIEDRTIERCAQELEKAYAECSTLNLLHGAARLRALTAAAEVGAERCRANCDMPAAEVGEPYPLTPEERHIITDTIERCARRLDAVARGTTMDVAKTAFEEAAAIIRELKL